MKLKVEVEVKEKPEPQAESIWPADAIFEYDGWGTKIMIHPRRELWVKECTKGKIIRKENSIPFRRDKENFYYIERGTVPPADDWAESLIPSKWDENQ